MKTLNKKRLQKELDKLWSLAVRSRDKHTCQWCLWDGKKKAGNQPHHIIPRARGKAIRWDIRNGITLCFYCHHRRLLEYPVEFAEFITEFLLRKYGITYGQLKALSVDVFKPKLETLTKIKEKLELWIKNS